MNQVGKRFCDETHGELPDGTGYKSVDAYVHGSIRNTKAKPHTNADGVKQDSPLYVHAALALNEGSMPPDYAAGPVWVIFDAAAAARRKWNVEPPFVDKEQGYFFVADTLEELARQVTKNKYQKVPMPAANLAATVAGYNSFVDLGKDEDFDKPTPQAQESRRRRSTRRGARRSATIRSLVSGSTGSARSWTCTARSSRASTAAASPPAAAISTGGAGAHARATLRRERRR